MQYNELELEVYFQKWWYLMQSPSSSAFPWTIFSMVEIESREISGLLGTQALVSW